MHTPLLIHSAGWRREREKSHRDFLTRRLNESQTYYTHKHSPHIHRITIKRRCEPKCQKSSSTGLCIYNKQQKKKTVFLFTSRSFSFSSGVALVCCMYVFWFLSSLDSSVSLSFSVSILFYCRVFFSCYFFCFFCFITLLCCVL